METNTLSPVGQVVKRIMMGLSDFPGNVELTEISGGQSTILEVSVRKSDHGKILGRGGRNVNAVREILACHSGLQKHRFILEVLEGEREGVTPRSPFSTHPSHAEDPIANTAELLIEILRGIVDDGSSVQVNPVDGLQVAVFEVKVARDDNWRVIGRGGRVVTALRELLMSIPLVPEPSKYLFALNNLPKASLSPRFSRPPTRHRSGQSPGEAINRGSPDGNRP